MSDQTSTSAEGGGSSYARTALAGIAGNPDLRSLLLASLLAMVVTELYRKALPLYFEELGIPVVLLGVGLSLGNVLEVISAPVSGAAADEFDRFGLAALAALAIAVALVGIAAVGHPAAVIALMAGFAVARLSLNHAVTPAVSDALEEEFAGLGWGIRDVAIYLGSGLGLGIGGVALAEFATVGSAFLVLVPVAAVLAAVLWRRRSPPGPAGRSADDDGGTAGEHGGRTGKTPVDGETSADADDSRAIDAVREWLGSAWPPSVAAIPRPAVMARFAAVTALSNLGMGMSVFLLPVYAAEAGLAGEEFLFLFSATFLVSAPLSVVGGIAADRYDRKRLFVANFAVEALMLSAFAFVDGLPLFLVGTALYVFQTAFEPAVVAFFFQTFDDDESGRAWGIDGTVSRGVGIVAPTLGSVVYASDPGLAYLVGAAFLVAATGVALTLPRG